ncbi:MAG: Uma2 family endonuclease [Myxococcota bacterium]|jgi:Uma2 family endonuclease
MSELPEPLPALDFPESDGAPMGESGDHIEAIIDLLAQLRHRYRERDDTYIGSNQFMYWEPTDPKQSVCPDIYLAFGRPSLPFRRTWKIWEEDGHAPDLVVEVTSPSTRHIDRGAKRGLYGSLGVRELVLFDPLDEYLRPRLQGFRLAGDTLERIPASPAGVYLQTVGVWLRAEGKRVQAWSEAGERLPAPWHDFEQVWAEREALAVERDALVDERDAMAARLAAVEAELARLRGG